MASNDDLERIVHCSTENETLTAQTDPFRLKNGTVTVEKKTISAENESYKPVNVYLEECKLYNRACNEILIEKANDIQEKMIIAKNILKACKSMNHNPKDTMLNNLRQFTNLPEEYLMKLRNSKNQKEESVELVNNLEERSMIKAIRETKQISKNVLPFIFNDIRDLFIEYYVEKNQIPSRTDFLLNLLNKRHNIYSRDNMNYIHMTIRTLVKNNLVKYHNFPKINKYLITENAQFMYKRNIYLSQIMRYRDEKKPIVYVAVKQIENVTDKRASFLLLAASSTHGLIAKNISIETADEDVPTEETKQWLRGHVIPELSSESIVVLTQPRIIDTIPTPYSTASYIKEWLQKHDIPFNNVDHKGSLYDLVKIFKKRFKDKGIYENIISNYGFDVVVCPPEYETLDFFADIYEYMRKSICSTDIIFHKVFKMINRLTGEEWVKMEYKLIENEKRTLREDDEMDKKVENILQMVKNGDVKAEDFPMCCSGTKVENFMVHIGDIIVD